MVSSSSIIRKVLVVGSTGATGKHVVNFLLDRNDTEVVAIARSKEKLMDLLDRKDNKDENNNLIVKEASIANLTVDELRDLTKGCSSVVSCLGHNLTLKGVFRDEYFVSGAAKKLTKAMPPKNCRFILMGSDGVVHPDGVTDPKRSRFDRFIVWLLRRLLPPHKDNEMAVSYLHTETTTNPPFVDWCVVRPGDLVNKDETEISYGNEKSEYEIFDHPMGSLFGDNSVARSDVASFMANIVTMDDKIFQDKYNHKMPAIYGIKEKELSSLDTKVEHPDEATEKLN